MNAFEKILLGILETAEASAPIFVHSSKGIAVVNVGEELFQNILTLFAAKSATSTGTTSAVPTT